MKGYKALGEDMRAIYGNGMQFEVGKKYTVTGEIVPCKNGFHFCKKIVYLNRCYDIKDSRIFEIEAYGDIKGDYQKYAAESICLMRELTKEEINGYFKQNYQKIIYDKDWLVRTAVAKQGYGLDVLVCDEHWLVRKAVAEQGYGLDILLHDNDCDVRNAVARQGYGLDELVYDQDYCVREIAKEMEAGNKVGDAGQQKIKDFS